MSKTEFTKNDGLELAMVAELMLGQVDMFLQTIGIEKMEEALRQMEGQASIAMALPFPATQNAADDTILKAKVLEAMIDLFKARQEQIDETRKGARCVDGREIARALGLLG